MAIKNPNRKPFIEDNDNNIFIGLDLPIRKSHGKQGYFASSKTTIEAVKNNIRNLLNTNQGERLYQPTLGLNLKKYLFEQINDDVKHYLGGTTTGLSNLEWDGYMAEVVFQDGVAHTGAGDFGEFDSDSPTIWKPKDVSGLTFGSNGFYLDFEDSSAL